MPKFISVNTLFTPKKSKARANGKVPIYLRITVDGKRAEISTSTTIDIDRWNSDKQCVKGRKDDALIINRKLSRLETEVDKAHTELLQEDKEITAKSLKLRLKGEDQVQKTLIEVFQKHNEDMKEMIGKDYSESTYKKYKTTLKHIRSFLKKKYSSDLKIKNVDLSFLEKFERFLKTKKNPCSHNTTMKYLSHLKKITNIALKEEWMKKDPFSKYDKTYNKKDPVFLSADELQRVEDVDLEIDRLDRVRDVFIFSCYTGLAFSDVESLTQRDIKKDNEGDKYIMKDRTKTNITSNILLLPKASEIIEKYKDDPETTAGKILPMISNQKTNAYLKEIATLAKVDKKLTHHIARHTFATTVTLEQGIPIETVSKILGHNQLKTTMIYAQVTPGKVNTELKGLKSKLS